MEFPMARMRTVSVLCAVVAFAVTGTFTATTVIAEPVQSNQQTSVAHDKADPNYIAPDRVLTAAEGIEIKQRVSALDATPRWRWMGNYSDLVEVADVANMPPVSGAGGSCSRFSTTA
jgi:hypothetical protein